MLHIIIAIKLLDSTAPISEGAGLTVYNNQLVVGTNSVVPSGSQLGFFDINNNLNYLSSIPISEGFASVQYQSSANVYWGLSRYYETVGTVSTLYQYVFKVSPSGSTILSVLV